MNVKRWLVILGIAVLSAGCQKDPVYTLSQSEVKVPVKDHSFDPMDYLRKDGAELSEEERLKVKTSAAVDTSVLGDAKFRFPEYNLELSIHVVDEEAPELSLMGFEVEQGIVLTWNEDTIAKLKPQMRDNYDSIDLLKKSLHCDSVDTSKAGTVNVTCYVEDSSGNQGKQTTTITVIEKKK